MSRSQNLKWHWLLVDNLLIKFTDHNYLAHSSLWWSVLGHIRDTYNSRITVCTYLIRVLFSIQCPNLSSSSTPLRWWMRGLASSRTEATLCCFYNCWSLDVRQLCHMLPSPITFYNANAFHCSTALKTPHTSAGCLAMDLLSKHMVVHTCIETPHVKTWIYALFWV